MGGILEIIPQIISPVSLCRSRTYGLGSIVERRKRSPLEDPVKNAVSFNDR